MPVFDIYDEKSPRRVIVTAHRVTIGRTTDNNVVIFERLASRQHCEVRLDSLFGDDETDSDTPPTAKTKRNNADHDSDLNVILPDEGDSEMGIFVPEDDEDEKRNPCERKYTTIPGTNNYFVLRDLQSRNGTVLNEHRLQGPTPLCNGDEINIGKSAIRFWIDEDNIDPAVPKLPLVDPVINPPDNS